MKQFEISKIRNVVLLSHSGVGKTTVLEHILFNKKVITRLGSVADGTSQVDYLPFEIEKKISLTSKIFPIEEKDCKVNFIDTPGYPDFIGEVIGSLSVCENAMLLIDPVDGVQITTMKCWKILRDYKVSKLIFINKLDVDNSAFAKAIESIRRLLTPKIVILQIPVGEASNFQGIIDLITNKFYKARPDGNTPDVLDIPEDQKSYVEEYRTKMIDSIAETNDELMEKYLGGEELNETELFDAMKKAIIGEILVPVLCGSAAKNCGLNNMFEKIIALGASPQDKKTFEMMNPDNKEEITEMEISQSKPFTGLVFKTVVEDHLGELTYIKCYSGTLKSGDEVINSRNGSRERIGQIAAMIGKNRVETGFLGAGDIATLVKLKDTKLGDTLKDSSVKTVFKPIKFPQPVLFNAVKAEVKKDQEKLTSSLHSLAQADPTFKVYADKTFNEFIICGMGELQLDLMLKKTKQKVNVNIIISPPRIAYKETLKRKAEAQGKYKKQSGGRGQYGDCHIRVEPLPKGTGVEFENAIFGGAIPSKYVPAVEKGVRDALQRGYLAGYEIVDVKVAVFDGTYHDVDSSDLAFQIAGSFAVKAVCEKASPVILEPIMNLEVHIPESYMGDVIGDINARRGRVLGMDSAEGVTVVKTQVPEREIYKYATDLRSLTRGQGDFFASFSHYEEATPDITKKIITETEKFKQEAEEEK